MIVGVVGDEAIALDLDVGVVVMEISLGVEREKSESKRACVVLRKQVPDRKRGRRKSARPQNSSRQGTGPQQEADNETRALHSAINRSASEV